MAIIKFKAMKNMSEKELKKKEDDLRLDMAKEKGKIHIGSVPENPGKIRETRRTLARILTFRNQQLIEEMKKTKE